jgi:methyl-accepting chemotaxis protein
MKKIIPFLARLRDRLGVAFVRKSQPEKQIKTPSVLKLDGVLQNITTFFKRMGAKDWLGRLRGPDGKIHVGEWFKQIGAAVKEGLATRLGLRLMAAMLGMTLLAGLIIGGISLINLQSFNGMIREIIEQRVPVIRHATELERYTLRVGELEKSYLVLTKENNPEADAVYKDVVDNLGYIDTALTDLEKAAQNAQDQELVSKAQEVRKLNAQYREVFDSVNKNLRSSKASASSMKLQGDKAANQAISFYNNLLSGSKNTPEDRQALETTVRMIDLLGQARFLTQKYITEKSESDWNLIKTVKTSIEDSLSLIEKAVGEGKQAQVSVIRSAISTYFENTQIWADNQQKLSFQLLDLDRLGVKMQNTAITTEDNGWRGIQTSQERAAAVIQGAISMSIISLVAAALAGIILGMVLSRSIVRPLSKVTQVSNQVARVDLVRLVEEMNGLANGDLTRTLEVTAQPVDVRSRDEIGHLASVFNQMIQQFRTIGDTFAVMTDNLRQVAVQVSQNSRAVAKSAEDLLVMAQQTNLATDSIADSIQQVASGAAAQTENLTHTAATMDQLNRAITGIAQGAQEQAESISSTAITMNQLAITADSLLETAKEQLEKMESAAEVQTSLTHSMQSLNQTIIKVSQESEKASQAALDGNQLVKEITSGMQRVRETTNELAQRVGDLGKQLTQIGAISETIDEIAAQTNLLALNAAIEAARAGEHGKGFAVVADEVRKLAERTKVANKEIGNMVHSVQDGARETVKSMQRTGTDVNSAVELTTQASEAFEAIAEATQNTSSRIYQITDAIQSVDQAVNLLLEAVNQAVDMAEANRNASNHLRDLSGQVGEKLDSVSAVVEENTAATEQMAASAMEVNSSIDNIANISTENNASAEKVSATTEEVLFQAVGLADNARKLSEMAAQLISAVDRFKVE